MSPALLEVEGLDKHFGGVAAVRDASFAVTEGSITALIGPNGAGKTTMFNLVSGFLRPDRGMVRFAGQRIERAPPSSARSRPRASSRACAFWTTCSWPPSTSRASGW